MGSVARGQLSLAGAFLATMRSTGMALSVAVLGGIAASQLGEAGGRLIFGRGGGAEGAVYGVRVAADFARGYSYAMYVGAAFAVVGALASLTRGQHSAGVGQRPPAPTAAPDTGATGS